MAKRLFLISHEPYYELFFLLCLVVLRFALSERCEVTAFTTVLLPNRFLISSTALYRFSFSALFSNKLICIVNGISWLKRTPSNLTGLPFCHDLLKRSFTLAISLSSSEV